MERVEAIKILRELHDKAPFSVRTALETLIPELKESRDEQIRKAMLQHFKNKTKENWCNIPVKDIISWLEKQKDHFRDDTKMVEQKQAEWSEEDEDKLEQCIRIVSGWEGDYDIVKSPYSNFLKSLRPSWKPSEEQVATLKRWLQDHELDGDSRYAYPIFYSLFTDLQKLL